MATFEFTGSITIIGVDGLSFAKTQYSVEVGKPFSIPLEIVGGTPPYTVTKLSGPSWLTINGQNIEGTMPSKQQVNATVNVKDSTP